MKPLLATVTIHHPEGDERMLLAVTQVRTERDVQVVRNADGTVREVIPGGASTYHLEGIPLPDSFSVDVQSSPTNGGVACDTAKGACACGATH